MRRPKIAEDFSNVDQVVDYFSKHGPNKKFMQGFHWLSGKIFNPEIIFEEGARQKIETHLFTEDPTIVAMTHHSWFDPPNIAAAIQNEPVLRPIIGRAVLPANVTLFKVPILGSIVAAGGGKPIIREKDMVSRHHKQPVGKYKTQPPTTKENIARLEANNRISRVLLDYVDAGGVYASYVEGTRNRGDQLKIQKVRKGVKKLLEDLSNSDDAKIITVAYNYRERTWRDKRRPTMFFDIMNASPVESVLDRMADQLQDGLIKTLPEEPAIMNFDRMRLGERN